MGNRLGKLGNLNKPVNYNCPNCMRAGNNAEPNLAGRFFLINEDECKCNGCNAVFPKSQFYKIVVDDVRII